MEMTKNHETRLQRAEIKFPCGVAGYTRADHQHDTEIRKKCEGV